jgi:carbonic anhydrase
MLQFHFHNAEHTVNYAYMPLEVHMVHQNVNDEDDILVLGTFLGPGAASPFFKDLESAGNADPNNADVLAKTNINAYDLLPKDLSYWHYKGGLTTPPCQKKKGRYVKWYVFKTPNTLSYNQLYFFTSYFKDLPLANNGRVSRDVQKVLDSTVIQSYP